LNFEIVIIYVEGAIALPRKESIRCAHGLGLDKTHVDEDLYTLLNDLPVDGSTSPLKLDLIQDCTGNSFFRVIKDVVFEHGLALLAD
jgi:hypothetical protein